MKVGIMQPYFMPYIGYFQLIKAVDKYVIYDDVTYIKGGWINRNNILINNEKSMITVSLAGSSSNKRINETEIKDDFKKLIKTININYSKAPFFTEISDLLNKVFLFEKKTLSLFIENSIKEILKYLDISTPLVLSSSLEKDSNLSGQEKVLAICKELNATHYYNAIGGMELYNKKIFTENGIELSFLKTNDIEYKQFSNFFVPNLSIIDVLMFNSIDCINDFLEKYILV